MSMASNLHLARLIQSETWENIDMTVTELRNLWRFDLDTT